MTNISLYLNNRNEEVVRFHYMHVPVFKQNGPLFAPRAKPEG